MLNLLFSRLTLTKKSDEVPSRVITVKSEGDLASITDGVARYEYSRGVSGKIIVDFTELRGIEDQGDRIKVLSGTPWRDVIKYSPEIFGNLDFSVGGSVFFGDAGFGFNEFKLIKDKVEVEAYINGEKYQGKYNGGLIYSVLIRKETKELVSKIYETSDFDTVYFILKNWFSAIYPPFRDISLIWEDGKFKLIVSYTKIREILLKNFISDLSDYKGNIPQDYLSLPHKYRYFGKVSFSDLPSLKEQIKKSVRGVLRISPSLVYFSLYSNTPLTIPNQFLAEYSDSAGENLLNGCIMCGRCVEVCPYGEYMNSKVYTPLGFYVLQSLSSSIQINCHMCGRCVEVCPANLDILSDLRKTALYSVPNMVSKENIRELKKDTVILLTPLSLQFKQRLLKALLFLYSKGSKVGILYVDVNINDILKGNIDWKKISEKFSGIGQIITLTPEEYYYFQPITQYVVTDLHYIEEFTLEEAGININDVHIPCYIKNIKSNKINCSFAFLDFINGTNSKKVIKEKVTLCPFTANKLNLVTPLDLILPNINEDAYKLNEEKLKKALEDSQILFEDAKWYIGVADELYYNLTNGIFASAVNSLTTEEALILYIYLDKLSFSQEEKKILEEKLIQLLTK